MITKKYRITTRHNIYRVESADFANRPNILTRVAQLEQTSDWTNALGQNFLTLDQARESMHARIAHEKLEAEPWTVVEEAS